MRNVSLIFQKVKSGISLFIFTFILFTFIQNADSQANYVYHEQTVNNPGCGPNYMSTITPNNMTELAVAWKVEYQFNSDRVRLYYTIDGTTPAGALGVGSGTTQVVTGSYNCTFGGPVVDVATATIPAVPTGTIVKYIVSAWNTGGGDEIFANGPGAGCACGTPTNDSALATVFMYTAIATNPVEVTSTGGTVFSSYATISAAFAAINAGTHTGTITIRIVGDTTEPIGGAILNASGAGAASYTTISIQPSGGAPRTITGAATAGLPLIDFNGADNVTFNGLNTGGNSLTISNTTVSATSVTSTIRFIGGATNNTITNCNVQGSGTMAVATNGAVIFFSTDAITANGNDNNTISNCNIGPAGANLPTKGILGNGSTSTTAIGNSGILIDNNNIFDYFGAAVTSSGIAINGGCNTWTITNNRFYQTGTRTWTTGAAHRAIDLNGTNATSGVQGMTVTGNIVGYASNTQTGIYTLTGAGTSAKFVGIVHNGISTGTTSNINNNTIAAVSMTGVTGNGTSTSSPFTGILLTEGNLISNGNTIGSQSITGSLTFSTTTTLSTDVYGIYNFSSNAWTSNSNNIGGISVTNLGASGTFVLYGLRANTVTSGTWTATSNLVGGTVANSIQLNATGTSSQVLGMHSANAPMAFTLNTIRNLTTNIGTGTTTSASVIGICHTSSTPTNSISQSTIFNLSNTNATAASIVTGIQFTGATGNVVERNFIHSLTSATTSTSAEINGIRVAGGTTIYRNNMIALGGGVVNAIGGAATNSAVTGISGINEFSGTNSFFHNTVYIGGTATAGAGASYAFNGVQTSNTRSFRNNIFQNSRTNSSATGKHYAVKINGSTPNPTGLTINNNVYFANGASGAVFGFFNTADVVNIGAWKTAVGQDAGSYEGNPQLLDPINALPDLHINPSFTSVAEANGVDVGVTNDYDGQTRSGLTPVDIGADAGNFTGIDLTAPVITYTNLTNTTDLSNRTTVSFATITDISGVNITAGTAPRIYYKRTSDANNTFNDNTSGTVGWKYAESSTGTSPFDFTIDYSLLNGAPLAIGDVIQYFVVAQDLGVPTVGINSGTFAIAPASVALTGATFPIGGTIKSYTIQAAISGIKNIPGDYPSLTLAGGAFEAINNAVVTGNITLQIAGDLTGENGTIKLNEFASPFTVTIKPTGAARTITGSLNGSIIGLNGADRVTIDGSTSGASAASCLIGGNAALRELTIQNTNTGTSAVVISLQTGTNGAQNNTIKNVNVLGQDPTTTLLGISIGGNTPGTLGTDNDNNKIENCSVKKAIYGIYSAGASLANQNTGTIITNNDFSALTTDRIRRVGIAVFNENGIQITENSIGGIETNESFDAIGIALGILGIDATITTSGGVTNALVSKNKINGVASLSATGFSAAGIAVAGATGGENRIQNNMITGVTAPSTSPDLLAGIYIVGAVGSDTRLYYNSVSMTGDRGAVASQMPSYGIAITGTDPVVELKNNIFYTTQIATGGGVNAKSYAIGMVSTTFTNLNSNNNDFWSAGANDGGFRTGSLGSAAGTDYATLALWQVAVSDDANSLEVDPVFINPLNDLDIPINTLYSAGTPIVGVTDDIDCNVRSLTTPTIGAYSPRCNLVTNSGDNISTVGTLRFILACVEEGDTITFDPGVPTSYITAPLDINKNVSIEGPADIDFDFSLIGLLTGPYGLRVAASKTVTLDDINIIDKNNPDMVTPSVYPVIDLLGTLITIGSTTISKQ